MSQQEFKGRLPYHLKTRSEIVRLERPREFEVSVVGDLTGKGIWTLTPSDGRVHIHFDWRVIADRPLLRVLTPVLRPRLPLEPQLVDQAGDRGPGALRALRTRGCDESRREARPRRRPNRQVAPAGVSSSDGR